MYMKMNTMFVYVVPYDKFSLSFSSTDQFDNFLLHLLSYFHCFFDKLHQEHKINTTTYM